LRKKEKDWISCTFCLETNSKIILKELAEFEGMSQSEFLSFLINNWDTGINPQEKCEKLQNKKQEKQQEIAEIENELKEVSEQIRFFNAWNKQKEDKKEQAIEILKRFITKKDYMETERIAKTWQKITGVSAIKLIAEAQNHLK